MKLTRAKLTTLLVAFVTAALVAAQQPDRALNDVLSTVYQLRDFTAFDWITGSYNRGTLTLEGFVRNPGLRKRAEEAARSVARVDEIVNKIELLPPLASDDTIRLRAYEAIYTTALERYAPGGRLTDAALAEMRDAERIGLDAADVGRGPHGIHIIVSSARLLLLGQVRTTGDRQQAEARVRTLPGVLGVTNRLLVPTPK